MAERPWPLEKFRAFRRWLEAGGLEVVRRWAEEWGDYVVPGERAPMTGRKKDLIAESASEGQQEAAALAEALKECGRPAALAMKDIADHVRAAAQGRVFDSDYDLRRAMTDEGLVVMPERVKHGGRLQYILLNVEADKSLREPNGDWLRDEAELRERARKLVVRPAEVLETRL